MPDLPVSPSRPEPKPNAESAGPAARDGQDAAPIERLLAIMAALRDPETGCPWDVEQTFATIAPYTIEEAYEVADAIEREDMADLKGELGDLLLQVVFHAQMADEAGHFDFQAVARTLGDKLISRHPHVFGGVDAAQPDQVNRLWEALKEAERKTKAEADGRRLSVLDDVAKGLPALLRAVKLQKRAARVGFDWPDAVGILDKIVEEVEELRHELTQPGADAAHARARTMDELGDVLFALVNLARRLEIDPEAALRHTNQKFERRFRRIEETLATEGTALADAGLERMEALWQAAKAEEAEGHGPGS